MSADANNRHQTVWWLATALLVVAVIIDAVDGAPAKLATSVTMLAAAFLGAATRPPRPVLVRLAIATLLFASLATLVYRVQSSAL